MPRCSRRRGWGPREAAGIRALQAHLHQFVPQRSDLKKRHNSHEGIKFTRTLPYNSKQPTNLPKKLLLFFFFFFSDSAHHPHSRLRVRTDKLWQVWSLIFSSMLMSGTELEKNEGICQRLNGFADGIPGVLAKLDRVFKHWEYVPRYFNDFYTVTTAHMTHLHFLHRGFFFSLLFWSLASHQNSRCGLVFSPCSSLSLYYYHSQLQVAKLLKAKFGMRHIASKPTAARWLYFTNTIGSNNLWSTGEEERYGTTRGQWTLSIAK